jgi:hypothetical protein
MDDSDGSWFDEFTDDPIMNEDLHDDDDVLLISYLLDEDQDAVRRPKRGGSKPGRAPNKPRRRELYAKLLFDDYWGNNPVYSDMDFRRRFRMPKGLFEEIFHKVVKHDSYFEQKPDALKVHSFNI